MNPASAAIMVRGISKRYGTVMAVDDVSLEVQPGEVYALLGLNGAGKTTLIRMLLGMVRTTAGDIEIGGQQVTTRAVWSQVGYLVETPSAYPEFDANDLASRVDTHLDVGARDIAHAAQVLRKAGLDPDTGSGGLVLHEDWAVLHPELVATALVRAEEPPTQLVVAEEDLETYFLRLVSSAAADAREGTSAR